jgi:FKBP-type peptidyl-prolyl cis-trans isomerase (trigger factor)
VRSGNLERDRTVAKRSRRTAVPYEAPSAGKANQPDDRGEEVAPEVTPEEDLEAESRAQREGDKDQGAIEKVKEKGKELLDEVAGPDVPPSLTDEEKRT